MQTVLRASLAAGALALPLLAQSIVAPSGYLAAEGNSNNAFPFNRGASSTHYEQIYDSTNFTGQTVNFPVLISRLRFRVDGYPASTTWAGGTWPNVQIDMSTSPLDYMAASAVFATNHGPDRTTVYSGPVTVTGGAGNGSGIPGIWYIDIPLTSSFLYDPASGNDLTLDIMLNGAGWSGASTQCDAVQGGALMTRIYELSSHTSTSGTVGTDYGLVTEFTYLPAAGAATVTSYGSGCYNRAGSFYETFATSAAFDLANSGMTMIPNGSSGYTVVAGIGSYVPPSGAATSLTLSDDSETTVTLGSPFIIPNGITSALTVCSNGYVSAASGNGTGYTPSPGTFLGFPQTCYCATLHDYNPAIAGSGQVKFEEVGTITYVTWDGVWDYGGTSAANANTFQYQFDRSSGIVNVVWQTMSGLGNGHLTGFHTAGSSLDPGGIDISALLPTGIQTGADLRALSLAASPRPVIGNTVVLTTSNVPVGTLLGVTILSLTQHNPGIDLTSLGMAGCFQYVGFDAMTVFFPVGTTGSLSIGIPNNIGFAGVHLFSQSAAFAAGLNTLGVIASNGINLGIGTL